MKSKAEERQGTQGAGMSPAVEKVRQLLLGMVAGMAAAKQDLMQWAQEVGLAALEEVFEADATMIAGPKGRHLPERRHHRWGTTKTELPFGGRRIQQVARERKNTFEALMEAARVCSLGSISHALFDVGGEYRRDM